MAAKNRPDLRRFTLLLLLILGFGGGLFAQNNLPPGAQPMIVMRGVAVKPIHSQDLPTQIRQKGSLAGGCTWQDKLGQHYLTVFSIEKGTFGEPDYYGALIATEYLRVDGQYNRLWKTLAKSPGCLEAIELDTLSLLVTDLDQDGRTECYWGFRISPDGEDPVQARLELHLGKARHTISGQFAGAEDDLGKVETMVVDPSFAQIPPIFGNHAQQTWKTMQQRYYNSWQ